MRINMEVNLKVNDKDIPLNEFAKGIIGNIFKGILSSLKKIPENVQSIKVDINL